MSKKKKDGRVYSLLTAVLAACAALLVVAIAIESHLPEHTQPSLLSGATSAPQATAVPLALSASPTAEPAASATPAPEAEVFEFLPVYTRAQTAEKVIAITMDGCREVENLGYAVEAARQYGAALTLFPYGEAVMSDGMGDLLRRCVFELGFEVENRTWSNGQLYRLSETEMLTEIWSADVAVDYVLNMEYDMHFFRMYGGTGARDARTHAYLKQLGYDAIVNWTVAGSDASLEDLTESLEPGNIYLFDTSEDSVRTLESFMEFAAGQGYRMVTLNELLGYEQNAMAQPTEPILSHVMPALENYEPTHAELRIGDRAWETLLLQMRLSELGYLAADGADGIYGESTSAAVSQFQAACGLMGTGIATTETQDRLFADDAPRNTDPAPTVRPAASPTPAAADGD